MELTNILSAHKRAKKALMLWGSTGVGKTSSVKQYAQDEKMAIIIRNAVYLDPLNCWLPRESPDGLFIVDKPHKWVHQVLTTDQPTVLFLDEITRCRSLQIMNMLTELILERTFNGEPLSPFVQIVMASNLYDEDNGLVEIPDAVLHRMTHIIFAPTSAESMNHMRTGLGREVILMHPKVLKSPGIPDLPLSGNPRQIDEIVELWETNVLTESDLYVVARGRIGLEAGNLVAAAIIDIAQKKQRKLPNKLTKASFAKVSEVEQAGMGIEVVNLLQVKGTDPRLVADYLIQYALPETCRAMQVAKFIYSYPADYTPVDKNDKPIIDFRTGQPARPGLPNIYYEVVLKKLSDGGG